MPETAPASLADFSHIQPLPDAAKIKNGLFFYDLVSTLKHHDTWLYMAWSDIKLRYQRTVIGPFWMVLVSFISIVCIAALGSMLFRVKFSHFFPYVACGMVMWQYVSLMITESGMVFLAQIGLIKNVNVSLISFTLRMFVRNTIVMAHSLVVVALVLLFFKVHLTFSLLLFIPGLLIVGLTGLSVGIILGFLCARYRDMLQLVQAVIGILAFMTPIMWQPDMLGDKAHLAYLNPLTHYIEILRKPLLGEVPFGASYIITLGLSGVFMMIAAWVYQIYHKRLVYWL